MARKRDKRDKRGNQHTSKQMDLSSDNDSVFNDVASIVSITSNVSHANQRYDLDDGILSGQQSPDYLNDYDDNNNSNNNSFNNNGNVAHYDDFKSKLPMIFDELQTNKSQKERVNQFNSLIKAFQIRYLGDDYLENRKMQLEDIIEHSMKRSNIECGLAANVLSLALLTIGDEMNDFFQKIYDNFERVLMDPTAEPSVRSKVATALSFGVFITDFGTEKIDQLIQQLLMISMSSSSGHLDSNQLMSENSMKANCLNMFSLLTTIVDDDFIVDFFNDAFESNDSKIRKQLMKCLDSNNSELRIAVGELLALLMENMFYYLQYDPDEYDLNEIREKFAQLANDSQKSRSKKELREQRSNFRQILRTIDDIGQQSSTSSLYGPTIVKFGNEKLEMDSWKYKCYYDTFCSVLGSGMNIHLSQNQFLRDIFGLGPVQLEQILLTKDDKANIKNLHETKRKNREVNRLRSRDKRSGDLCD